MKKKIALLLAGVMALSTLPMSVFAADNAKVTVGVRGRLNANSSRSKTIFTSNYYGLNVYRTSAFVDNNSAAAAAAHEGTQVVAGTNDGTAFTPGTDGSGVATPVVTADTTALAQASADYDTAAANFTTYATAATTDGTQTLDADAAEFDKLFDATIKAYNAYVDFYNTNIGAVAPSTGTADPAKQTTWVETLNTGLAQATAAAKRSAKEFTNTGVVGTGTPLFVTEANALVAPTATSNATVSKLTDYTNIDTTVGNLYETAVGSYRFNSTATPATPAIEAGASATSNITALPAAIAAYTYTSADTDPTGAVTGPTVNAGLTETTAEKAAAIKIVNDAGDRDVAEAPVINIADIYGDAGAKFDIVLSQASGTPEWAGGYKSGDVFNDGMTNAVNNSMNGQNGAFRVRRNPVDGEKQKLTIELLTDISEANAVDIKIPVIASTANNANPLMATVSNATYNTNGKYINIDDTTVTVATVTNDAADGNTTTTAESTFSGKTNLKFHIKTKENVSGVFGSGYYIDPFDTTKTRQEKTEVVTYTLNSAFKWDGFYSETNAYKAVNDEAYANFEANNGAWTDVPAGKLVNDYGVNVTAKFRYGTDINKLQVKYTFADDATTPTKVPAAMEIKDLAVVPKSGTAIGTDATFTVVPYTGSAIAKQSAVKAGTYSDYTYKSALAYPDKAVPALQSGRLEFVPTDKNNKVIDEDKDIFEDDTTGVTLSDEFEDYHQSADLKVSELVAKSFINGRTIDFTFPEGVNVAGYEIINTDKSTVDVTKNEIHTFENDTVNQTFDENKLSITNYKHTGGTTDKASFIIRFYLAADANFTGDAAVTVSGDSLAGATLDPVTVATFAPAFKLDTKLNTIKSGVQQSNTSDIVISETEKGRFEDGETVYVKVDTGNTATLRNAIKISDATIAVTEGDLEVEKFNVYDGTADSDGYVTFKIANVSSTAKPGTITLSNVKVSTAYGLPETSSYPFDIVINTDNDTNKGGKFHSALDSTSIRYGSLRTPYINVKNNSGAVGGDQVVVSPGSTTYTVAGVEKQMDVAPFIDAKTSSLMVPVRFIADGVGITEESGGLIWSANNKTVIIRNGNDTIEFPVGSNFYRINGAVVYNENNAVTQIVDGRTFVPFRTMGNVLGIPVTWDDATRTATYN